MKKRNLYCMAALVLGLSLLLSACGSGSKSMRLRKAEGTVKINNAKDKELKTKENLKLYSGYNVRTKSESYAWVDLDSVKLTKLDQDSRAEIIKDGKDLTIELISGSIFFNVTEPLKDNESMDIRTSTLAIGIRGTCGWVETSEDDDTAWVYLLEGKVECTMGDESVRVRAGEMATITEDGELVVAEFDASAIPSFVQDEADGNEDVDKMIQKVSDSGASSAPKESGAASNQGGAKADADGQGGMDAIFGQGGAGSRAEGTRNGTNTQPGTPASNTLFIPWDQAGLTDHAMDWQDDNLARAMAEITGKSGEIMLSDVWELKELPLSMKRISNVNALGELRNLETLYLDYNDIAYIGGLSGLTNLKTLNLCGNSISDISALSGLTTLTTLNLDLNKKIRDISALSGLINLTDLSVGHAEISDISVLGRLTNLNRLYAGENKISDISVLSGLTGLKDLSLFGNQISDVSALSGLTDLEQLNLSRNSISDVSALSGLTKLMYLGLDGNGISDVSALSGLTKLFSLHLQYNPVTDYSPVTFVPTLYK